MVETYLEYASMDSEWNIYSPCTALPGGGVFEGEEENMVIVTPSREGMLKFLLEH